MQISHCGKLPDLYLNSKLMIEFYISNINRGLSFLPYTAALTSFQDSCKCPVTECDSFCFAPAGGPPGRLWDHCAPLPLTLPQI